MAKQRQYQEFFLRLFNRSSVNNYTVTLFNASNSEVTTYRWAISSSFFPGAAGGPIAMTVIINNVSTSLGNITTAAVLLAALNDLSNAATFSTYTSGTNEIFYTNDNTDTWGRIAGGGSNFDPTIFLTAGTGGEEVEISGSASYEQIIRNAPSRPYLIKKIKLHLISDNSAQMSQPMTLISVDSAGIDRRTPLLPVLNPYQYQSVIDLTHIRHKDNDGLPLDDGDGGYAIDGIGSVTYPVLADQDIRIHFTYVDIDTFKKGKTRCCISYDRNEFTHLGYRWWDILYLPKNGYNKIQL